MTSKALKLLTIGVALALSIGIVAACGGDDDDDGGSDDGGGDTVDASTYVGDICGALADFQGTITAAQTTAQSMTTGTPEEGQQVIADFFADATVAGDELASAAEDAGVPDVEGGEEAADAVSEGFTGIADALSEAQSDAEGLPTDSPTSFETAAESLLTDFQTSVAAVADATGELESNSELEEAAEDNEDCQELESSGVLGSDTGTTDSLDATTTTEDDGF